MGINKIQATVQESLLQHLYNKATGRTDSTTLKFNIPECDLYGDEPCKIWSDHYRHGTSSTTTTTTLLLTGNNKSNKNNMKKNEELYVFTKLKKKSVKGTRFDRTVGDNGAWKGEDSGVKIYCDDNPSALDTETATPPIRVHGVKKRYRYESSSKSVNDDGRWIMYEYSLDASMLPHAKVNKLITTSNFFLFYFLDGLFSLYILDVRTAYNNNYIDIFAFGVDTESMFGN